jgi:hypothetical protein
MRRWIVMAMAVVMLGAMSAGALADDTTEATDDGATEVTRTLSDAQLFKARMLADYFAPVDGDGEALTDEVPAEEPTETSCEPAGDEVVEGASAADLLCGEIVALRTGEDTVGWGAIYKLMLLWQASQPSEEDLASGAERTTFDDFITDLRETSEDGGWGFGKLFKELRDEGYDWGDTHKNLGQLNKETKAEERAERKAAKKGDS